ncbi:hypothetical protein DSM04_105237 [Leeuwenhoekiella aestuarii]|uniref:Uncharacterized protein n=2 Tax=Leeuwenhoekiella aestuarii TaxID=2249426 RepID=A0A4Q0NR61_9FLAO|nr:hypothetical protein DSM04_105237 [Leeuwenhoekiella aestuarii]
MATLAHRIAKDKHHPSFKEDAYKETFNSEKKSLLECDVSLVKFYEPLDSDKYTKDKRAQHKQEIELYLFEVYIAVKFKTLHNSFRTH